MHTYTHTYTHREEQSQTENEKRRRETVEMRSEKNEHMRVTIAQDNERLLHMLKEAEDARTTIEQVFFCSFCGCAFVWFDIVVVEMCVYAL